MTVPEIARPTSPAHVDALLEGASSGFRRCIVAAPGCSLVEADFSAIEAVILAWFASDPIYYRYAKLGVHAIMASQILALEGKWERIDESWSDEDIKKSAAALKASREPRVELVYSASKRTVHMSGYAATSAGMHDRMPSLFPTRADAKWFQDFYFKMAPRIRQFQLDTQAKAAKQHYIGGPGQHPFAYKHWFWDVHRWQRIKKEEIARVEARGGVVRSAGANYYEIKLGDDAKRCVAFLPQSTAAAIIRLCGIRLFAPVGRDEFGYSPREEAFGSASAYEESYIGNLYFDRTPLRALIHDSFLMEIEDRFLERAITCVLREMRRPIPEMPLPWDLSSYLTLDADVKVGKNWAPADEGNPEGMRKWKPAAAAAAPEVSEAALDKVIDEDDLLDEFDEEEEE